MAFTKMQVWSISYEARLEVTGPLHTVSGKSRNRRFFTVIVRQLNVQDNV
jgi:hypothetical protein